MAQSNDDKRGRRTFLWLYGINRNSEYSRIALAVATEITAHVNKTTQDAYPSAKTIGDNLHLSVRSVLRAIRELEAGGDLRIEWGSQGRGHPNHYFPILPVLDETGKAVPVSNEKSGKVAPLFDDVKVASGAPKSGTAVPLNHDSNQGDTFGVPLGERGSSAAAASGGSLKVAPRQQGEKEGSASADPLLAILRSAWVRKAHVIADNAPAAVQAQRLALDATLQGGVAFEVIDAAAKAFAAAYDPENNGRKFLPSLATWLRARGWEQPPPNRKKPKRNGANGCWPRKPKNSSNPFFEAAGMERGADGVMREIKGRTH